MRSLDAYKVDAFTSTPYTGNIAGVVPNADGLTDAQMQRIAREMNVSETAFLMAPTQPGAQRRVRYFTPSSEIKLCGHATVAAFHVLAERGDIKPPAVVKLQTNVGILDVDVRADGRVFLASDPVVVAQAPVTRERAAALLGLAPEELRAPILLSKDILVVPVSGLKAMETLRPDLPAIKAMREIDGVVALTYETTTPGALTRIRYFVPGVGIDEDPVTGVAHMALAAYLLHVGRIQAPARFVGEQGFECGRPGVVSIELDGPNAIRVGGQAVTTLTGKIVAP